MTETFIGRQAIYDASLEVHAYELLYRSGRDSNAAEFPSGELATARVIANAFLEMGAQRLVGEELCFINLTADFLRGELPLPLPADRVVVEVLEDVEPTLAVVRGIVRLRSQGVAIALDDYVHRPENSALLRLCDYVKVDIQAQSTQEVAGLAQMLRARGIKLLAEKVETMEEMRFCRSLGFEYFQGYFLTRPEIVEGRSLPANRFGLLRMLSKMLDPAVELEEIEQLVGQDPALAYRLLRYANSALYAPEQPIEAVGKMLVVLGLEVVRRIVSLMVMLDLDERPGDLLAQSLVRAKMCELLAQRRGVPRPVAYYTTGLFSALDAMTGTPMEEILSHLPLAPEIGAALLRGDGDLGAALGCVRGFEAGDWDRAVYHDLGPIEQSEAYAESIEYSRAIWASVPHDRKAA